MDKVPGCRGEAKTLLLFLLFIHDFVLHITVIPFSFRFFLFVVVVPRRRLLRHHRRRLQR